MDRARWLAIGCALLLLVGGVYTVLGDRQPDRSPATYLDVSPVEGTVPANQTVGFTELSPEQQRLFERAHNTTGMVEITSDPAHDAFVETRYVRYENRTYATAVAVE